MKKSILLAGIFAALLIFTACQQEPEVTPDPKEMLDIKLTDIEWSEGVWKREKELNYENPSYKYNGYTSESLKLVYDDRTGYYFIAYGNDIYKKDISVYYDSEAYNSEKDRIYGAGTTVEYDDATLTITKTTVPTADFSWDLTSYPIDYQICSSTEGGGRVSYVKQSRDKSIVLINMYDTIWTFTKQ